MRLIDADKCPCYYCNLDEPKDCHSKGCRFWDWLKNAPTIGPVKGKWVDKKYCSECGFSIATDSKTELLDIEDNNFCYNCGAHMREE